MTDAQISPGWKQYEIESRITFAVPSSATLGPGQSVDSAAGYFDGPDYQITFDLGRFSEDLDSLRSESEYSKTTLELSGRTASEVSFVPSEDSFEWARVVQLGLGSGYAFTMRVSCQSRGGCAFAEDVFNTISIKD